MDRIRRRDTPAGTGTETADLVSVVVEHDHSADQCTFYDPEATGVDRMSSWITAEMDAVVDLSRIR